MYNNDAQKRKRGGQPGNHNARKHGFYFPILDEDQKQVFREAAEVNGLDEEIGIIRLELRSALKKDPANLKLVSQMLDVLTRLMRAHAKLGKSSQYILQKATENVLREVAIPLGIDISQIRPDKMKEYLDQKNANRW
jgi:hypothetical protein